MYEQQTPFEMADYVGLSSFLNNFLFRSIQENIFGELCGRKKAIETRTTN